MAPALSTSPTPPPAPSPGMAPAKAAIMPSARETAPAAAPAAEAPAKRPLQDVVPSSPFGKRQPCVGLPVQFSYGSAGEIIPGVLQRQNRTDPSLWDVRIWLNGAHTYVTRAAVKYSETPAPGCWSFLPI